jgi:CDP-diacylglycerol--inositol 3-phosphatidyltransferase
MSGVQTRKKKMMMEAKLPVTGEILANGHAKLNGTIEKVEKEIYKQENIFIFIPNIIGRPNYSHPGSWRRNWHRLLGYSRVFLAIASLYYMPLHPRTCSGLYSISCLLDALDGYAARHYNQSTTFGAVLDMVTDRCTTACLLVFLASAWPRWSIVFQGLISLDLASHYMHMYASLSMGRGQSHKKVDSERSYILHLYYTNRVRPLLSSLMSAIDLYFSF